MANPVLLNNVDHKDLRVFTRHGHGLGDDIAWVQTFPGEFRLLQAYYPVVFRKTGDEQGFEPVALFGFETDENLFLEADHWDAATVPLLVERHPFLIGRQGEELSIHIDLDHPRVGHADGEALFLPHGGMTPYLEHVNSVLRAVHEGMQSNRGFVEALLRHELLEGFSLDVELDNGSQHRLAGFYTINEERLAALDAAAIAGLHAAGMLAPIYFQVASLSNFRSLIDRKNRRHAQGG